VFQHQAASAEMPRRVYYLQSVLTVLAA